MVIVCSVTDISSFVEASSVPAAGASPPPRPARPCADTRADCPATKQIKIAPNHNLLRIQMLLFLNFSFSERSVLEFRKPRRFYALGEPEVKGSLARFVGM